MASVRSIVIRLSTPDQLFTALPISPMSPDYTEFTAQPAMDTVRDVLLMRMPHRQVTIELQVVLPSELVTPGMNGELTHAVRRWVQVQNIMDVEATEAGGAIGRQLFVIGLLAFMALQTASIFVGKLADSTNDFLLSAISEALSVSGWVMLWFPVQMFTMEVWRAMLRRRRMRMIERLTVVVLRSGDMD